MNSPTARTPAAAGPPTGVVRRVSWGAIFAGSVIAAALMLFFATLGIGIGASTIDPTGQSPSGSGLGIGGGIYAIVAQIIALAAGGYVAARLAGIPRPVTSVLHGATVWAVTTLFLATVAITGGSALFGAASSLVGTAASGVASVARTIVPDDLSLPDPGQLAGEVSFDALPDPIQQSLQEQGITPENIQQEAQQAFRQVISEQERQAIVQDARQTLSEIVSSPGNIGADLQAFVDETLGGQEAVLSEDDRAEALTVLQSRTGISPEEAEAIVAQVEARIQEGLDQARQAIEAARQQALEAAEAASNAAATAALLLALASFIGLCAACGGAFAGKPNSIVGDRLADHV